MIISVCCVCKKSLSKVVPDTAGAWHEGKIVESHGYCKKDAAVFLKELEKAFDNHVLESTVKHQD